MGDDKKPEKKVIPAFLEGIAPHMYTDPASGTRGIEFGFRWNYENPNGGCGDNPHLAQQPCSCGGAAGALQQQQLHHGGGFGGPMMMLPQAPPQQQHHGGGFGGPMMMLPPAPPQRQLAPFMNPNMMMAGQGWPRRHPAAGRFMGGAPPMGMQMHRRRGGFAPHQQAANFNYYGGFEYEYDYPAYPGGYFRY